MDMIPGVVVVEEEENSRGWNCVGNALMRRITTGRQQQSQKSSNFILVNLAGDNVGKSDVD
jgi:hypothetical protein